MEKDYDSVLDVITPLIPSYLFCQLWKLPETTSISQLKKVITDNLPEEYPNYNKIMDILNEVLD